MRIILPLPPSDNRRLIVAWRQRRMISSNEYRQYKKIVEGHFPLKKTIYNPTFENQLDIYLKFYLKDKRRDATDMLKCLLDALTGLLYTTDKWVVPIIQFPYYIDKKNPRVEVML